MELDINDLNKQKYKKKNIEDNSKNNKSKKVMNIEKILKKNILEKDNDRNHKYDYDEDKKYKTIYQNTSNNIVNNYNKKKIFLIYPQIKLIKKYSHIHQIDLLLINTKILLII